MRNMDILQQSLKAADILSGDDSDDLFGQLGITFNAPSDSSILPNDLQSLANQNDALYASDLSAQENYDNNSFDTSQFLNTSAPVSIASTTTQPSLIPISNGTLPGQVQHGTQQTLPYGNASKLVNTTVSNAQMPFATFGSSTLTTTIAQNISVPTCSSVFSKAPTQTLASTVQRHPAVQVASAQAYSVSPSVSQPMQISTPIQVLQPHTVQQQGNAQVVTLVQKPTIVQLNSTASHNPTGVQNVNGMVVPQNNVAVVKISGAKAGLNLSDPQVIKALTANLVQRQTQSVVQQVTDGQSTQPQFIKLAQNSSLLNVISPRPQQNTGIRGAQQITLSNGQKILVNNGQQVQLCTTQPSALQHSVTLGSTVTENTPNGSLQITGSNSQQYKGQVPIKGIQIASVNIPIISSSGGGNSGTMSGNTVLTIPVVSKQDGAQHTVNHANVVGVATNASSAQVGSAQASSTVRGLLSNMIQKTNNQSPANAGSAHTVVHLPHARTQVSLPTPLRFNLSGQQGSQLNPLQLQNLLKQRESTLPKSQKISDSNSGGLHPQQINIKPVVATHVQQSPVRMSPVPTITGNNSADRQPEQVFKVDPTITQAQVDEVKKLLTSRTIASKLHCLSKEQQQLVLAFQAQIKTMSPPVQQYYLRNPQLFMQKVLQQTRSGKPFILHVKADALQKAKTPATVPVLPKQQHPTISLTTDSNRLPVNRPSPVPVPSVVSVPPQVVVKQQRPIPTVAQTAVSVPRTGIKRPAPPEQPTKVTLVVEQLDCHKRMVMKPDCATSFTSVKQEAFDESEKIFDQISDRIVKKTRAMLDKYHLLRLRDSTREACSADMVMIERMFLQKEKSKYAQDKARLKEDPSLISEYFPKEEPRDPQNEGTDHIMTEEPLLNGQASKDSGVTDVEISSAQRADDDTALRTAATVPDSIDGAFDEGVDALPMDGTPGGDDSLLQEAVDSILL